MSLDLRALAWHSAIANLITKQDHLDFWDSLIRLLSRYATIDNWVVLIFSNDQVQIVSLPEMADTDELDGFTQKYVKGLYLLDPFYIANRENPQSGFFHLREIAPAHFSKTEYYNQYFAQYISADEAQYNVKLDEDRTLCLSFGSKVPFGIEQIVTFDLIKPWVLALMHYRMSKEVTVDKSSSETFYWQRDLLEAEKLTVRETEVLKLIVGGYSNKEIALKLSVSVDTIKTHKRNVFLKLQVKSQAELFARFFSETSLLLGPTVDR